MLTRKTKIVGLGFALVLFLVVGAMGLRPTATLQVTAAEPKDSNLKGLLKERHAILRSIASQIADEYRAGKVSFAEVHAANQTLHRAELDQCDTDKERAAVLEKMLAEAKENKKQAEAAYHAGQAPARSVLAVEVDRLEVEIALARLQATAK
jgi:outer membrane protein TolC